VGLFRGGLFFRWGKKKTGVFLFFYTGGFFAGGPSSKGEGQYFPPQSFFFFFYAGGRVGRFSKVLTGPAGGGGGETAGDITHGGSGHWFRGKKRGMGGVGGPAGEKTAQRINRAEKAWAGRGGRRFFDKIFFSPQTCRGGGRWGTPGRGGLYFSLGTVGEGGGTGSRRIGGGILKFPPLIISVVI